MAKFSNITSCADWGMNWLLTEAWPLWLEFGVDWNKALFNEHIRADDLACGAEFRRLRVAARQIYVFSHAARHGVPKAADAVRLGFEFLTTRARIGDGMYVSHFDVGGIPLDRKLDLYDHSFVLLAFASAADVLGAKIVEPYAQELGKHIDTNFSHRLLGFNEAIPSELPRRQNPHMHLLEASLAAYGVFRDPHHLDRATKIVELFLSTLFQWNEGALPEYFDDNLVPIRDRGVFLVEPGHHCEWVWLLDWYMKTALPPPIMQVRIAEAITMLFEFLDRYGETNSGADLVNEVDSTGKVHTAGSRLWPQTERIKAELRRPVSAPEFERKVCAAVDQLAGWLDVKTAGLWIERKSGEGVHQDGNIIPASSLYHITCALLDLRQHSDGVHPAGIGR